MPQARIPTSPGPFHIYMRDTYYCQSAKSFSSDKKFNWEVYQWTEEESLQWTEYYKKSEELYLRSAWKPSATRVDRNNMYALIKEVRAYDNNKISGHHLLDKVAKYGREYDWKIFSVRNNISLVKKNQNLKVDPDIRPMIWKKEIAPGLHRIKFKNQTPPKKRYLPIGVRCVKFFRYIGAVPPKSIDDYKEVGKARHGIFTGTFENEELNHSLVDFAWYIARYETTKGKLCAPSDSLKLYVVI